MLNYLLIPRFGGVGAAYTSLISYLVIFAVSVIYLKVKREYYFADSYYFISMAIVTVLGIVFYFVKDYLLLRYIVFLAALLCEGIYLYVKKDQIISLFGGKILARNE